MSCAKEITGGFSLNCTRIPKKGIVQSVTIMNTADINDVEFAEDAEVSVSEMYMKVGKRAYLMEGTKTLLNAQATFVPNDNFFDGWKHSLTSYIGDLSPDNLEQIKAFTNGAEITAIVETKYAGANGNGDTKWKMLGYPQGMVLTEAVYDANENGGLPFTLSNKDGFENNQFPLGIWDNDEATTRAIVEALQIPQT